MTENSSSTIRPDGRQPLRLLCVGTGRDGTVSLTAMIQGLYDVAGHGQKAMHEYRARDFYNAFSNLKETGDEQYAIELRRIIGECPHDCIVGNGYASVLSMFAEHGAGGCTTLVHLRRANRTACIESLMKDCELFPAAYKYFSDSSTADMKRLAAFHFGEMTREQWDRLTLRDRFGWYYDKTHDLIRSHSGLFKSYVEITTESLNDEATRRLIARLAIDSDATIPPPTHLNAHRIDVATLPADRQPKMQWLMGRLNLHQMAYDDVYAMDYFLEKYSAWTSYQITGSILEQSPADVRHPDQIAAALDRAERILQHRLRDIAGYRIMLAERGDAIRQQFDQAAAHLDGVRQVNDPKNDVAKD